MSGRDGWSPTAIPPYRQGMLVRGNDCELIICIVRHQRAWLVILGVPVVTANRWPLGPVSVFDPDSERSGVFAAFAGLVGLRLNARKLSPDRPRRAGTMSRIH